MNDADRYVWLLSNMGLVNDEATRWDPKRDKPLLLHLQDFIDKQAADEKPEWFEKQRTTLRDG